MAVPLSKNDPAYWMLEQGLKDPSKRSVPFDRIHKDDCYICTDPEFALMGLPLCYPCSKCGGHTPADDVVCENGHEQDYLGDSNGNQS